MPFQLTTPPCLDNDPSSFSLHVKRLDSTRLLACDDGAVRVLSEDEAVNHGCIQSEEVENYLES